MDLKFFNKKQYWRIMRAKSKASSSSSLPLIPPEDSPKATPEPPKNDKGKEKVPVPQSNRPRTSRGNVD